MLPRLTLWFLLRLLIGAALLAGGRALDALAGFRRFPPLPGFAAVMILQGALVVFRAVQELKAAGPGSLVECGPYRAVRHPLSSGLQLVLLGAAVGLASPGCLLAAGPLALLLWGLPARLLEEPALERRFPRQYRRYQRGTGFLIPSMYFWSLQLTYVFYRLWCGLRLQGLDQVPRIGPFFLIALHRNYMDPFFMAFHIRRRVSYLATSVLFRHWFPRLYFKSVGCIPMERSRTDLRSIIHAFRQLDCGGAVGMFPEGARSWYGETACEPAVFRILEKRRVPIVTAELGGAFEQQPRFSRRVRRSPLSIRYRLHPPSDSRRLVLELLARERRWDERRRCLARPLPARTAEQLVYLCPQCRTPFRCRGYDDGRIRCSACGAVFTLLEGKGLRGPFGVWSLPELEKWNLAWARDFRPSALRIAGQLLCRQSGRRLQAGALVLGPEGLQVEDGRDLAQPVRYGQIQSVLVESNRKLEFSYRQEGRQEYVFFLPHSRYAVFLQHYLRLAAFGNSYARYRGSNRQELEPLSRT